MEDILPVEEDLILGSGPRADLDCVLALHLLLGTTIGMTVMATFLRDKKVLAANVIAVQEPWKNELQHTTHEPATASWSSFLDINRHTPGGGGSDSWFWPSR
jgi:hypothetical protein